MKAIFVCTHGKAAQELICSAEMICGAQENVSSTYFKEGEAPDDLSKRIKEELNKLDLKEGILFLTDLKGGTPFNVLIKIAANIKQAKLLSGVNIPMLLDAFINRDLISLSDLSNQVAKSGVSGIYQHENRIDDTEEDF